MRILALDLGKYKTVACDYEAESGRHRFTTVLTGTFRAAEVYSKRAVEKSNFAAAGCSR
jgi:hypothetical protein